MGCVTFGAGGGAAGVFGCHSGGVGVGEETRGYVNIGR